MILRFMLLSPFCVEAGEVTYPLTHVTVLLGVEDRSLLLLLARSTQPLRFKHASRHRYLALSRTTPSAHEPHSVYKKQTSKE